MRGASAGAGFKAQAPVSGFRAQSAVSGFRFQSASAGFRFQVSGRRAPFQVSSFIAKSNIYAVFRLIHFLTTIIFILF